VFHPNCMHNLEYVDEDGDEFKLQKDFPAPDDMDDPESMQEQKDAIDEERYFREGMPRDEAETEVMRDRIADNMRAGNVPTEDAEKIADGLSGDEVREIAKGGIPRFEPTKKGEEPTWNHGSAGGVVHYDRNTTGGIRRFLVEDLELPSEEFTLKETEAKISEIKALVGKAIDGKAKDVSISLGTVSSDAADDIEKATGTYVRGYEHVINGNEIRHSWKRHGEGHEKYRNQVPLSQKDYARVLDVYNNYDEIKKGSPEAKTNNPSIRYFKEYDDGKLVIVEVVGVDNELRFKTMWKIDIK